MGGGGVSNCFGTGAISVALSGTSSDVGYGVVAFGVVAFLEMDEKRKDLADVCRSGADWNSGLGKCAAGIFCGGDFRSNVCDTETSSINEEIITGGSNCWIGDAAACPGIPGSSPGFQLSK